MYTSSTLTLAALVSLVRGHGQILSAQGAAGSPPSVGFAVNEALARNCTTISPCQLDATIIREAEITANIVNNCGRTELLGNIDVGEATENAIAANAVTTVTKGSKVTMVIHQVNADGAGPYACDIDFTSNSGTINANLTIENNVPGVNGLSQAKAADFNVTVTMPADLACSGGSTGDICTVRCRNNAVAGPFGGCFAVRQTDITPTKNTPQNIKTIQQLAPVLAQVEVNRIDLKDGVTANQIAGQDANLKAAAAADTLLGVSIVSKASPVQTPDVVNGGAAAGTTAAASAAATTTAAAAKKGGNRNGNGAGANNGAANNGAAKAGNGAANNGATNGAANGAAKAGNGAANNNNNKNAQ